MGVSTDVNPDLAALFSDSEGFSSRLQQLKSAQASYEQALAELNLGKAAKAAFDEAIATRDQAARQRDAEMEKLQAEMKSSYETLQRWSDSTKAAATAKADAAQKLIEEALRKDAEVSIVLEQASKTLADAQAKASKLINDATSESERLMSEARAASDRLRKEAQELYQAADVAKREAILAENEIKKKIDSLNEAIAASA